MSSIMISDLEHSRQLDGKMMSAISGGSGGPAAPAGNSWLAGLGPVANVNVGVNQNISQVQNVEVNALNNVGVIGAGFGPLKLDVSPAQWANANVTV
jgi:hypothetical protein